MSEARRVAAPSRPARVVTGSLLAAIVLLAAGLRLHRLDQLPPGLFIDQAQYGLDAYRIFQGETLPVFVEGPGGLKERGREPLFMYLMAGVFAIVGPSPFAIKLTSALIGIAAVPVLYLAASRWLGTRVGLLAAAILAVSRWHITFSRMGFRAILVPLWIGLVAFALAELVRRRSLAAAVAFGLVLGAGFYTYPAYWSVPLALLLVLAVALWERRPRRHAAREAAGDRVPFPGSEAVAADVERGASVARSSLRPLIVAATVACLVVLAPLLAYASTRGEDLLARSSEVALFARGGGNSDAVETSILDGAQRVLFMLHLRGDSEPRHNLPGKPMLDPLTGLAFLGGLVALAKAPLPRATKTGVLAFWLLPLLPSAVTLAAPSGLRAVGTLPAVCAIAALGLDFAARAVERRGGRRARIAAVALVVALLGVGAVANARAYFVDWAEHPQIPVSYSADIPRFVEYLESLAVEADVVVCPYVHDSPNVRFLTLRQDPPFIPLHDVEALLAGDSARDRVFVCDDAAVNALIRRLYPEAVEIGRYAIYTIRTGRIHRVPRRALFRSLPAAEETQARHFILRMRESFAERSKAW